MNVVDTLVTVLRLDNRQQEKAAKESQETIRKTRTEFDRAARDMDAAGARTANSFRGLRNEVVGLFLAFTGANSIRQFATNLLNSDAATGRLAANLGIATEQLSAWQGAVKRVGGDAKDADQALSSMAAAFQNFQLTGSTGHDADFQGLGVQLNDLRNPASALLKIAEAGERMGKPEFVNRLQRIGLSPSAINLLERGRSGVQGLVAEQERLGVTTQKDTIAAQALDDRLARLASIIKGAVRPELTGLVSKMIDFTDQTSAANLAVPILIGLLGSIGIAATIAYAPVAALAGVISGLVIAWRDWKNLQNMSTDERAEFDRRGSQLHRQAWDALKRGDAGGFLGTIWEGFSERAGLRAPKATVTGNPGIAGYLKQSGFSDEQSMGIQAGIHAESGGNPNALNRSSGAFGIGQWLGARKQRLFARYGPRPNLQQQMEFLVWELNGGDHGGRAVRGQQTADGALNAYVRSFMRPAAGGETAGDIARGRAFLGGGAPAGMTARAGGGDPTSQSTSVGQITIYTPATDAKGIARDIRSALGERGLVVQAASGMVP